MEEFIKVDQKKLREFPVFLNFFYSVIFQIVWILSFSKNYNIVWDINISHSSIFATNVLQLLNILIYWLPLI